MVYTGALERVYNPYHLWIPSFGSYPTRRPHPVYPSNMVYAINHPYPYNPYAKFHPDMLPPSEHTDYAKIYQDFAAKAIYAEKLKAKKEDIKKENVKPKVEKVEVKPKKKVDYDQRLLFFIILLFLTAFFMSTN